jgi:hypothetical protein
MFVYASSPALEVDPVNRSLILSLFLLLLPLNGCDTPTDDDDSVGDDDDSVGDDDDSVGDDDDSVGDDDDSSADDDDDSADDDDDDSVADDDDAVGDDDDSAADDDDDAVGDDDDDDDSAADDDDDDDSAAGDDDDDDSVADDDDDDSAAGDDDDSAAGDDDDDDSAAGDDDDSAAGDDDDSSAGDDDDSSAGDDDDSSGTGCANEPWVNEFHYDNPGSDQNEGFEVAGPAGFDLTGWTIELYNGSNGSMYSTVTLSGQLPDDGSGFGALWFLHPLIQNGAPDGFALINPGGTSTVFLSYEGTFNATAGAAMGETSFDIGVFEGSGTAETESLQLDGDGCSYGDFTWQAPQANTWGAVNTGQTFQ